MSGTNKEDDDFEVLPESTGVTFEVVSGEATVLHRVLAPQARVFVRAEIAGSTLAGWNGPSVHVHARRKGEQARQLGFRQEAYSLRTRDTRISATRSQEVEWLPLLERQTCRDFLEPGLWTFWAELEGHVGTPVDIELGVGENRRLDLELVPR
tara:strand:- start:17593 stop:18051 length:459 start_codon:yes stop_codon:yes gene_type:complete